MPNNPRWRYQAGIGEERAALIDAAGTILEARIEPDTPRLRLGAVHDARAVRLEAGRFAIVEVDGHEAIVEPRPTGWTDGQRVRVEVIREALAEVGVVKRARVRPNPDTDTRPAPSLLEQLIATGWSVDTLAAGEDVFAEDDERNVCDEAMNGTVPFDTGQLHIELTRTMTLIDVDGWAAPDQLTVRAAAVAALAIRRLGIGGSIGIDFPTVDRAARAAGAAAFDAKLPQPFERTAINGFGFMQVVRPRRRPSLPELFRDDAVGCAVRLALGRAQQAQIIGALRLVVAAPVARAIESRPDWLGMLARSVGGVVSLRVEPLMPIWSSYAELP